ncbi:hypothetical protein M5689_017268 [Euphorbia peplus]|nr:hypothetical protein M5689_017268 [Euphorbia peplus]
MHIRDQIMNVKVGLDINDNFAWTVNISGRFTVKDLYSSYFTREQIPSPFKLIWNHVILPSRSLLVWRILKGAIPTHDKLQQRGLPLVSRCCFCLQHGETMEHIFVHCIFASNIWRAVGGLFGATINTTGTIFSLIEDALQRTFSKQVALLWLAAILQGLWLIWHSRNLAIFEDTPPIFFNLLRQLWAFLCEIDKSNSSSSSNALQDFHVLHQLGISARPCRAPKIIGVRWKPPTSGWLKINTDGSALGAPGRAGSGGIFRTARGFSKGCFAFSINCSYAHLAELRAAIHAISVAWERGWHNIWLECDSSYVVELFKKRSSQVPWEVRQDWLQCMRNISDMSFVVSHIFREGNRVADALARFGQSHNDSHWWPSAPDFCSSLISDDLNFIEQFRFV